MPIEISTEIRALGQEEFHQFDKRVLRLAFDIHNEFGRLLDEALFKEELAARCVSAGLYPVEREVGIRVSHSGFYKEYFLDLLIGSGFLLELKTVEVLAPKHRAQVLNYLFLAGLRHASLVNIRPERVKREFVSTSLTLEQRRSFRIEDCRWKPDSDASNLLRELIVNLVQDWGAFLEISLYRDSVTHLLGGVEQVCKRIPVYSGDRSLGEQRVHLLTPDTAFAISAVTDDPIALEIHQRRFLNHTHLKSLHWVNFNHQQIEFVTLDSAEHTIGGRAL